MALVEAVVMDLVVSLFMVWWKCGTFHHRGP